MKFDSYPRFIRSDFYKNCLEAESKKQPLPYPGDQLDVGLRTGAIPTPSKVLIVDFLNIIMWLRFIYFNS